LTSTAPDSAALQLLPLTFLPEGDGVVVGCRTTDSYAVLPPDGAALLQRLAVEPPEQAARWYEETYGEPVDLDDFLDTLDELGFVGPANDTAAATKALRLQRLGRQLFSPPCILLAGVLVAVTVLAVGRDPRLLPRPNHVFFSRYLLLIELTVAFGQVPLILIHEIAHVLAARRVGVAARIRVSHRMYFVVFETVMDGLVVVPRRRRYFPMLAGMVTDVLLACVLTLAAAVVSTPGSPITPVAGVCLALAFSTLIRFALEFVLFLRTDIYYLIATLTGTIDLHRTSSEILANAWWRLVHRPDRRHDPANWHDNDVRHARWYTPVHVLGYAVAIGLLLIVLLPISWRFATTAGGELAQLNPASVLFWDALGLLVLNTAQPAIAGFLWLRERARRRRARALRLARSTRPNPE
jgi:hypothetical protein